VAHCHKDYNLMKVRNKAE